MDVARFKYPPHWVSLRSLWRAMRPPDPETQRPRGYVEIALSPALAALQLVVGREGGRALVGDGGGGETAAAAEGGACCAPSAASRHCRGQGAVVDVLGAAFDDAGAPAGGATPAHAALREWAQSLRDVLLRSAALPHMCVPQLAPARLASVDGLRAQIERLRLFGAVQEALRATGGAHNDGGSGGFTRAHTLTLLVALRHAWRPVGQCADGPLGELAGDAVAALGGDPLFDGRPTRLGTGLGRHGGDE
jgi:hypothetical protein